jgi:hypothetical protein
LTIDRYFSLEQGGARPLAAQNQPDEPMITSWFDTAAVVIEDILTEPLHVEKEVMRPKELVPIAV